MTQILKARRSAPLPPEEGTAPAPQETWRQRLREAQRRRFETYRSRGLGWRLLVPAVFALAGTLFVTSSVNAGGTDLRAGRFGDLTTLVEQQKDEVDRLLEERNALAEEVEELSSGMLGDAEVTEAKEKVESLDQPAGLQAVSGPGLTVTLDDAPSAVLETADIEVDKLVVHQQDIQAVVNAMWAGGAEAMTIQGQRVISTTGVKCVGNTVVLHGIPYSPPYVITAVGDPDAMLSSINANPYIEIYQQYVEAYGLGWSVEPHSEVRLPPYSGSLELDYARPAGNAGDRPADSDL